MTTSNVLLLLTTTFTALMAGLFYAYSCSVVPGLRLVPDREYISVMKSINKAIQNSIFFICFFGTLLLLPVSTYLNYSRPITFRFWLLLTATILYLAGAFGVTILGNIPLNNALEKFDLVNASKENIHFQRKLFEARWNNLNIIRTVSSVFALILAIVACIYSKKVPN